MDVFLYRERDGRLVEDCAGLAMLAVCLVNSQYHGFATQQLGTIAINDDLRMRVEVGLEVFDNGEAKRF
jgi:hypothetical protein